MPNSKTTTRKKYCGVIQLPLSPYMQRVECRVHNAYGGRQMRRPKRDILLRYSVQKFNGSRIKYEIIE